MKVDVYLTALRKFIADGMTHAEAVEQFDMKELQNAVRAEFDLHSGEHPLFDLLCRATWGKSMEAAQEQAIELWLAGWKSETPECYGGHPMSLYWRRPPRRKNSKGMFFWSTNQAFMAMKREGGKP